MAVIRELVVKICQKVKRGILLDGVIIWSNLCVFEFTFHQCFLESRIKNFWSRMKKDFPWAHPRTNFGEVPPPRELNPS